VVARLDATNERFVTTSAAGDTATVQRMIAEEPLGKAITVTAGEKGLNIFTFA
jgi:hypothetical protein